MDAVIKTIHTKQAIFHRCSWVWGKRWVVYDAELLARSYGEKGSRSNQGHFLSTHCFPPSSYSCLEIHICWNVPCQTENIGLAHSVCRKSFSMRYNEKKKFQMFLFLAAVYPYQWREDWASYPGTESALNCSVVGYQLQPHALWITHKFSYGSK